MNEPRASREGDEAGLRRLWQSVFEDSDAFLDAFFGEVYTPGMASLMEEGGEIVSAAYAIPFPNALYLYAVATLPACRGRGCGKAVTLHAAAGRPAYLYPADVGLRQWYKNSMGAREAGAGPCTQERPLLGRLSAEEYQARRERLLGAVPHAVYPLSLLRLFCADGGGFYRTAEGCCAVDEGGVVRETLPGLDGSAPMLGLNGAAPLYFGLTLA